MTREHCLIYIIRNKINDKVYVGQTWTTTKKRWKYGYHRQPHMWNAIKLYGRENFYYEELLSCWTQEDANYFEKYFIQHYKANDREFGYNLHDGGSNGRLSEETKLKISKAKKGKPGRKQSQEIRNKISKGLMGRPVSTSTRKKIGDANSGTNSPNFGTHLSEDRRKQISEAVSGENHPFFGKHHNETSKTKMQQNNRRRILQVEDVLEIRRLHKDEQISQKEIAKKYNITPQTVNDIIKRRSWNNI